MEREPVAEILPVLYRAVLDAVGRLEERGLRREAATIRADATEAYSGAWNAAAARRLTSLHDRADKVLHGGKRQRAAGSPETRDRPPADLERTAV